MQQNDNDIIQILQNMGDARRNQLLSSLWNQQNLNNNNGPSSISNIPSLISNSMVSSIPNLSIPNNVNNTNIQYQYHGSRAPSTTTVQHIRHNPITSNTSNVGIPRILNVAIPTIENIPNTSNTSNAAISTIQTNPTKAPKPPTTTTPTMQKKQKQKRNVKNKKRNELFNKKIMERAINDTKFNMWRERVNGKNVVICNANNCDRKAIPAAPYRVAGHLGIIKHDWWHGPASQAVQEEMAKEETAKKATTKRRIHPGDIDLNIEDILESKNNENDVIMANLSNQSTPNDIKMHKYKNKKKGKCISIISDDDDDDDYDDDDDDDDDEESVDDKDSEDEIVFHTLWNTDNNNNNNNNNNNRNNSNNNTNIGNTENNNKNKQIIDEIIKSKDNILNIKQLKELSPTHLQKIYDLMKQRERIESNPGCINNYISNPISVRSKPTSASITTVCNNNNNNNNNDDYDGDDDENNGICEQIKYLQGKGIKLNKNISIQDIKKLFQKHKKEEGNLNKMREYLQRSGYSTKSLNKAQIIDSYSKALYINNNDNKKQRSSTSKATVTSTSSSLGTVNRNRRRFDTGGSHGMVRDTMGGTQRNNQGREGNGANGLVLDTMCGSSSDDGDDNNGNIMDRDDDDINANQSVKHKKMKAEPSADIIGDEEIFCKPKQKKKGNKKQRDVAVLLYETDQDVDDDDDTDDVDNDDDDEYKPNERITRSKSKKRSKRKSRKKAATTKKTTTTRTSKVKKKRIKYCYNDCKLPTNELMIGCDGHCRNWYHFKCVFLTKSQVKKMGKKKWFCPECD